MARLHLLLFVLASCTTHRASTEKGPLPSAEEIIYLSSDRQHVAVFSKERSRFGFTNLVIANREWPSSPAVYLQTNDGVQCLSVGSQGNSDEYAIKRPFREGESYKCLTTTFRVSKCFDECRAAIIEINWRLSGDREDTLKRYMYVDNCRGVIILGGVSDLSQGIPLNAEWLQGEVGILSDPTYPSCRRF